MQVIGIIAAVIIVPLFIYSCLRSARRKHPDPKYIPTKFLKAQWRRWIPRTKYGRIFQKNSSVPSDDSHSLDTSYNPSTTTHPSTEISTSTTGVDRNTSIRSIMTLPPYRSSPHPSERLIAREGERAGVDTVIEFPETADEEELRREADMDALYQIRQARRRENEAREERRRERREAREAGDWARLEQLRLQSEMRARADSGVSAGSSATSLGNGTPAAGSLTADSAARQGSRPRVSSVSYAELGLARHDGSRIRADSMESDHRPLLDSAASMGGSRQTSLFHHRRDRSAESILTVESDTGGADTPRTSTTRGERSGSSSEPMRTPNASQGSPPSFGGSIEGGETSSLPTEQPPGYEDEEAPPYTSPVDVVPRLPSLSTVPAIEITGTTPRNSVPATPVDGERGRR